MKLKRKAKIFSLFSILALTSVFAIGFSSFIITSPLLSLKFDVNTSFGVIENKIDGISVTSTSTLKMGKYFYFENNTHSLEGYLNYNINVDSSSLNEELKNSNENGGYSFILNGEISIDNLEIFNDDTYLTSITFNDNEVNIGYEKNKVTFEIDINTSTTSSKEDFTLSFKFSNKLILDYKDEVINKSFNLKLSR